jgi:hypothetical protein
LASVKGGSALAGKLKATKTKLGAPLEVQVGFLEKAKYPNGTFVAMVAAIQEFGAPKAGIPPRPFFRTMIAKHKADWPKQIAKFVKDNDYNARQALDAMGQVIAGDLRQSIVDTMAPQLSAVTLMLRWMKWKNPDLVITGKTVGEAAARVAAGLSSAGVSTKPLVETGHMLNSIDSEVVKAP